MRVSVIDKMSGRPTVKVSATASAARIAPSVLAGDMGNLRRAVEIADSGGADMIHLDVIDGHFAPNITFGPATVRALRGASSLPFDTHLMISEPLKYVERFIDAGSDLLTFHVEVLDERSFEELLRSTRSRGKKMGLAIKPSTRALPSWVWERLSDLDVLMVMTVNPGFSGQQLDRSVLPKLEEIARKVRTLAGKTNVDIEVDGGVELENVGELVNLGAGILVAGAAVYGKADPARAIQELRERGAAEHQLVR
jgi:ribulose-phosphate 3-epimerase